MKFELHIDCDNAAFEDDACEEIARILGTFAGRMRDDRAGDCGKPGEQDTGKLRDVNGNAVGTWHWDGESI